MRNNERRFLKRKALGVVSAAAMTLAAFSTASANSLTDANIIIQDRECKGGYEYISTYNASSLYGKSAFKLTYEYLQLDADGKYNDRDTGGSEDIDYADTFEFLSFNTSWDGWNPIKVGQANPVVGREYTATASIADIAGTLPAGSTLQGINLETGRIGDTRVLIKSLEFTNANDMTSSGVEFTGSWVKGQGGSMEKVSGIGTYTADEWKIDITDFCVYDFTNPTVEVTVNYSYAPNDYVQAEILNGVTGQPIVVNYPFVDTTGKITYTTEFNRNLTSMSVCYDQCTVQSIRIYDNTAGNVSKPVTNRTASQIAADMQPAWNLGNALEGTDENGNASETGYGNPVTTKKLIQAVKAAGFNAVRIPVSFLDKINNDNKVDPDYLARVKQVVDYAYDMGMYVVVDMHNDGAHGVSTHWLDITKTGKEFEAIEAKFASVWDSIADYFRDYDQKLLFEGYNELMNGNYNAAPSSQELANVNALAQDFVTAVRSTGGQNADRVLIVAGYNTNIDYTIDGFKKPADTEANRLMLSVHYYDPYDFTLNEYGVNTWGTEEEVDYMYGKIGEISGYGYENEMPIFIGEYGPIDKNNTAAREEYCFQLNFAATAMGNVVTAYWDNGVTGLNGSGLFNRTTNEVTPTGQQIIDAILAGIAAATDE